jgi:agmatinase
MICVSVDIDALDQSAAPGTCSPSPGGLDSWEILASIFHIAKNKLSRALDVMEVAPPWGANNSTSDIGAAILNCLCGLAQRR